jgi:hypothetical protein
MEAMQRIAKTLAWLALLLVPGMASATTAPLGENSPLAFSFRDAWQPPRAAIANAETLLASSQAWRSTMAECLVAPANATGQIHHPISKPVAKALDEHPNLSGQYQPRDPRFTTQAIDEAAHRGYQTWHRELDAEVSQWVRNNPQASSEAFEGWLRWRYSQPDLKARFPNGF